MISLQYIAGFFDGEGSVAVYNSKGKNNYCLRVQLTQNESTLSRELFDDLQRRYNMKVHTSPTKSGKTKLNGSLSGDEALIFLSDISQFTIMKRAQIAVAMAWHLAKPPVKRDKRGRITKHPKKYIDNSKKVVKLLKFLKKV